MAQSWSGQQLERLQVPVSLPGSGLEGGIRPKIHQIRLCSKTTVELNSVAKPLSSGTIHTTSIFVSLWSTSQAIYHNASKNKKCNIQSGHFQLRLEQSTGLTSCGGYSAMIWDKKRPSLRCKTTSLFVMFHIPIMRITSKKTWQGKTGRGLMVSQGNFSNDAFSHGSPQNL